METTDQEMNSTPLEEQIMSSEDVSPQRDAEDYKIACVCFHAHDLDWRDIGEQIDELDNMGERLGVVLRWMDKTCYDEDWKMEFHANVLQKHLCT